VKTRLFVIVRSKLPGVEILERTIEDVVARLGTHDTVVEFPWTVPGPGRFEKILVNALDSADLLICVSDGENHDVAFEMGYAHALKKPMFLVWGGKKHYRPPYLLLGEFWTEFDREHPDGLASSFSEFISAFIDDRNRIVKRTGFKVFISHRSNDKAIVEPIAARLTGMGFSVWYDSWEIVPGDSIPDRIGAGIQSCTHFVMALSENTSGSGWVTKELNSALSLAAETGRPRLIPIFLDQDGHSAVPPLLRDVRGIKWYGHSLEVAFGELLAGLEKRS